MKIDQFRWLNEPQTYQFDPGRVVLRTEPRTDLWQRTYYGFQTDNAPALLTETTDPFFTFSVKTEFESKRRYDQCGILVYLDSDNWFKASTEYENETFQRLGSVVTNRGYSDWATTDIPAGIRSIFYRVSRRRSDYLIEASYDGTNYRQMRIFRLLEGGEAIRFGVYACSPEDSSFEAVFTEFGIEPCRWEEHT